MTTTFSLATEPWIPVLTPHGQDTYSLHDVFTHATDTTITAGGHLEDTAIHRLLLAITYTALGSPDTYPETFTRSHGRRVATWITSHADNFDLLHPTTPFALAAEPVGEMFPAGLLDPTLGRSRPTVSDHRPMDAVPTLPFGQAAILVLVQQLYSVGGKHPGVSESLPESPATGLITFRPAGTVAQSLTWARIRVDTVGTPNWTWRERADAPGVRGVRPLGEADALTWLSRRIVLAHDGTQVTGAQYGLGWRRAPELDENAPFDEGAGRHAMLVAKSSAAKPAKATPMENTGFWDSSGDSLGLIIGWERGSAASLSGQVRAALEHMPRSKAPSIIASGQQIVSQALWAGAFATELDSIDGGHTERAQEIRFLEWETRRFHDGAGSRYLHSGQDEIRQDLALADHQRPVTVPGWPHDATTLNRPTGHRDMPSTRPQDMPGLLAQTTLPMAKLRETQRRPQPRTETPETATDDLLLGMQKMWRLLRNQRETADHLALVTRTRIPTLNDLPKVYGLPLRDPGARLWVGLIGTWLSLRPEKTVLDASTPFPLAMRFASRGGTVTAAREVIDAITKTAPTPAAIRTPLVDGVTLLASTRWAASWRALHHDLTHWTTAMNAQWTTAFWTSPTTKENTAS